MSATRWTHVRRWGVRACLGLVLGALTGAGIAWWGAMTIDEVVRGGRLESAQYGEDINTPGAWLASTVYERPGLRLVESRAGSAPIRPKRDLTLGVHEFLLVLPLDEWLVIELLAIGLAPHDRITGIGSGPASTRRTETCVYVLDTGRRLHVVRAMGEAPDWAHRLEPGVVRHRTEAWGRPLPMLEAEWTILRGGTQGEMLHGIEAPSWLGKRPDGSNHVLPTRVLWDGALVNAACWGMGWFVVLGLGGVARRGIRISGGRCPACRYDVRGIEAGVCPECGTALPAT